MATSQANDGTTDPFICKPAQEEDNISVHAADDFPAELDVRCEEMDVSHDDGSAGEHRDDAEDDDVSMDDDSSTISSKSMSRDEESEWYPPTSDEESDDSSIGSIVSDDHSARVNVPRSLKWKKDSPPCPIEDSIDATCTDTFVGSGDICVGYVPGPDGTAVCLIEAVDMALQNINFWCLKDSDARPSGPIPATLPSASGDHHAKVGINCGTLRRHVLPDRSKRRQIGCGVGGKGTKKAAPFSQEHVQLCVDMLRRAADDDEKRTKSEAIQYIRMLRPNCSQSQASSIVSRLIAGRHGKSLVSSDKAKTPALP